MMARMKTTTHDEAAQAATAAYRTHGPHSAEYADALALLATIDRRESTIGDWTKPLLWARAK